MTNIIRFPSGKSDKSAESSDKELNSPALSGEARCNGCGHKWYAVMLVGEAGKKWHGDELECPNCHAMKGHFVRHALYEGEGLAHWQCLSCNGFLFSVTMWPKSGPMMCCANCGQVTDAIELFPKPGKGY